MNGVAQEQAVGTVGSGAAAGAGSGTVGAAAPPQPGVETTGNPGVDDTSAMGGSTPESYGQWRDDFELTHFKVREPPKPFAEVGQDGNVRYYGQAEFKILNEEEPRGFLKRWFEDPDKKMFNLRSDAPGPYQKWKTDFEKRSFLSMDRKTVTNIRGGYITKYTIKAAMREFNSEFIKMWAADPKAQRCRGIDWMPPGEDDPRDFNMYAGFAVSRCGAIADNEVMGLIGGLLDKWRETGILDTMIEALHVLYEDHGPVEIKATGVGLRQPVGSLFKFDEPWGIQEAPKNSTPVNNSKMYMPPMIKLVKGGIVPHDIEIPGFSGNGYRGGNGMVGRALYQYAMRAKLVFDPALQAAVVVHPKF